MIDQFAHQYPEHVFTQRFEDLITDKKAFFKSFEQFTGIDSLVDIEDKRIDFKNKIEAKFDERQKDLHKESVEPLNSGKIGEYKTMLSQKQIDVIDEVCFPYALMHKYERKGNSVKLNPFKIIIWKVKLFIEKWIRKFLYRDIPFSIMKFLSLRLEKKQASFDNVKST